MSTPKKTSVKKPTSKAKVNTPPPNFNQAKEILRDIAREEVIKANHRTGNPQGSPNGAACCARDNVIPTPKSRLEHLSIRHDSLKSEKCNILDSIHHFRGVLREKENRLDQLNQELNMVSEDITDILSVTQRPCYDK